MKNIYIFDWEKPKQMSKDQVLVKTNQCMVFAQKIRLMIADDHLLFIDGLRRVVNEELGIDVAAVCTNGRDAIDRCLKENFDIVFMDINMPIISGLESTSEIKRLRPAVKIIIVSMNDDYNTVNKAIKAGADAYILKNDGAVEIEKAIKSVIKNEFFISSTLTSILSKDISSKNITRADFLDFSENLITSREQAVLKLIVEGFTNQEIAETLHISVRTVDTHRANMLAKLNLTNTASLVRFAIENKLV